MESKSSTKTPAPGPRLVRFANITLGVGVALAIVNLLFALQLHRARALEIIFVVMALALLAAYRLSTLRRVQLAFFVLPSALAFYVFEQRIASVRPYDATAAARRGVVFDTRSQWEAVRDARNEGRDAYPSLMPRALLVLDMSQGLQADEISLHTVSKEWGVVVGDRRVLPLGGVSRKNIVYCNEGGGYSIYDSDEHGFNNPKGIWDQSAIDLAFLGDSFTQAACVGPDENAAAQLRRAHPATLNLGMAGNGPLLELAGLEEFLAPKKPKHVLWVYYSNDMGDLDVEKQSPMLMRYLDEEDFTQGIAGIQDDVDRSLVELAGRIEKVAPSWPGWLSSIGLTRSSSPVWLGDLAMRESHSSASAVMRLDRLSWAITEKLVVDYARAPPDFPLFKRILARARDRVASWGGQLHFVYMADVTLLARKRGPRIHHNRERVLATARELAIPIIDTHPDFEALPDLAKVQFHPESHCSPEGYKLVGELIAKAL